MTHGRIGLSVEQITALKGRLSASGCILHEPGSTGYTQATSLQNGAVERKPALIAGCSNTNQVRAVLSVAQTSGLPVSVRNGGHDWAGRALNDGGLVLDLTSMRQCSVDPQALEATIAGGVTVAELNAAAGEHALAAVVANDAAVSMAGLLLGGGYGPLTTRFGLAADSLVAAEVVLADGNIARCDATHNSDLFWAIRGGGGNFAIVTSMHLRLYRVGQVLSGSIVFPWSDARAVLQGFSRLMHSAPDELSGAVILSVGPDGNPLALVIPIWSGDRERGQQIVSEIESFGTPVFNKVSPMPAADLLTLTDGKLVSGRGYEIATRWLANLPPDVVSTLIATFEDRTSPFSSIILQHFHGAAARVAPGATAFGMRQSHFIALINAVWEPARADATVHRHWAQSLSSKLSRWALPGGYANLLSSDASEQIRSAFGANAQRLLQLKRRFDPGNLFSSIPLPGR